MAGNKPKTNEKPLMVAKSTPRDQQDGVEVKLTVAALAKYEVNVRSFHPNKQFERAGFRFHGDNRGFSTGESYFGDDGSPSKNAVTSRIWQRYLLDVNLMSTGKLDEDPTAQLEQESNPSDSGPWLWSLLGSKEDYKKKEYKPRGTLTATSVNIPHGGQKEVGVQSWYGGENHAFLFSRTLHDTTSKTPVPTLDVFSDLFIRVERVNLYMDILSLVYGDGFPNCEAFIKDSAGNKLFLGTHVRIGVPATHLAGENKRLMWANAIRVEIDAQGNFGERLWIFRQAFGGPPTLREEYPTIAGFERRKVGSQPRSITHPFDDRPDTFLWDHSMSDDITQRDKRGHLHLSAFANIEQVREKMQQTWKIGPTQKITRTQWNESHQHRNPNDGRGPDHYDVSSDKWKKP